jgi:hypothetical protein
MAGFLALEGKAALQPKDEARAAALNTIALAAFAHAGGSLSERPHCSSYTRNPWFISHWSTTVLAAMSSTELHEFDLALRSDVQIAARAARVWACLEDFQAWKPSVVSVDRVEGASGAIGEVLRVGQRGAHGVVHVRMRTLQSEPGAWKVQTLETEDGRTTRGYVTYRLVEQGAATQVYAQLIARAAIVRTAIPPDCPSAEFVRTIADATRAKFDADHATLKRLAEGG